MNKKNNKKEENVQITKEDAASQAVGGSVSSNIQGYQAPMGAPKIKRKRTVEDEDFGFNYHDDFDNFEDFVAHCSLNDLEIGETVKKRGESWVVFDDKTGAQKGVFKDREIAWQKQRQIRKQAKDHKKKSSSSSNKPKLAPKPKTSENKEHIINLFKEAISKKIVKEASALSYVFEQSPISNDSLAWNSFLEKLSQQTILSDQKLKDILQNMAKMEVKLLSSAVNEVKIILQKNGKFEVEQKKPDQDKSGNLMLNFEVLMPTTKKKLQFFVVIEHGKPLIQFPDNTKNELNMLANEESKALRAALMFAQEDALDKMEELSNITQKRDQYLNGIQEELERIINTLDPLKISLLRLLLKTKYSGVK